MSLELVLLVPVLVLLTVFVLWAGRGGQVALTADLAAEEAATAAALCCEEDTGGASGREALVEDVLEARPGLGFLCIGGPRPDAGVGSDEFLSEHWLKFEPGRDTGGVGVLGVQFLCETDGAVAPLRGLFPTVTFHGQASEVVLREPRFVVGFEPTRVDVTEGEDDDLVFTVVVEPAVGEPVTLAYELDRVATTAEPEDFGGTDFATLLGLDPLGVGTVEIPATDRSAQIVLTLVDDDIYEGDEQLVLTLTGALPLEVQLDADRMSATGVIIDDDPQPHLFIAGPDPSQEVEGGRRISATTVTAGTLTFQVRLRDETNSSDAPSATVVSVDVRIEDITTTASDYEPMDPAASTWSDSRTRLTFDPGDVTIDVVVRILDDIVGEDVETFRLVLENNSAPLGSTAAAVGTIIDDEARVSVEDVEVDEGDALTPGMLKFQVVLDRELNADLSLQYELLDPAPNLPLDTAQRGTPPLCAAADDYLDLATTPGTPGTLTITWSDDPLQAVDLPAVTICGDSVVEPNESLFLRVWVPTGGEAVMEDDGGAFGTIVNDDTPVIIVDDETAWEAPAGGMLTFTVRVEVGGSPAVLDEDVTVQYDIVGHSGPGSATAIDDFRAPPPDSLSDTLTFTARGDAEIEVPVELLVDYLPENTETFHLVLSSPSANAELFDRDPGNTIDEPYAVGTILDDPPPVLSVNGFSGPEGTTQSFTASLSGARAGKDVTVDYDIVGDSGTDPATAIDDFRAPPPDSLSDTLTFTAGGDAEIEVPVELVGDYLPEPDETLRLTLTNPSGAVLSGSDRNNSISQIHATGTIENVDPPRLSVTGFTGPEDSTQSFTVELDIPPRPGDTVTVDYTIEEASPPSAVQDDDYEAAAGYPFTGGGLTFGSGVTSQTVPVQLLPDSYNEADETFRIVLSNPDKAHLDVDTATGTITNVDPPELTVNDPSTLEGKVMTFTVTLTRGRAGETVTVAYAVESHSAISDTDAQKADPPKSPDFEAVPPDTLTLDTNSPTATVSVQTLTDKIAENAETLHLVLSGQSPSYIGLDKAVGVGTITDVPPASVRVDNPRAVEGDDLEFVISLVGKQNRPAQIIQDVEVEFLTADRTATAGIACTAPGADYLARSVAAVTFEPGETTEHSVRVQTCKDTDDEDDETMALVLRVDPDNDAAVLGDTEGTGTIVDSPPPYVRIDNPDAVREGDSVTFTVSLEDENGDLTSTSEIVTVEYATRDRTAEAGLDYEQRSDTLTFDPDDDEKTITVQTSTDDIWEPEETFRVDLSQPDNAILDKAVGTGTIRPDCVNINVDDQDNRPPAITVRDEQGPESSLRVVNWLTLSRPLCDAFSFTVRAVEGTTGSPATDDDFAASTMPFSTAWGGRVHPASVSEVPVFAENHPFTGGKFGPLDDTLDEDDEYFYIEVSWSADMPTHYQIQDQDWARATVTIIDDDDPPNLRISDAAAPAGESMTFNVTLDAASGRTVQVDYRTVDVTADGGVDYDSVSSWETLLFDPGARTETFDVQTASNSPDETDDETFRVELANPVNAGIGDSIGVGTILAGAGPALTIFDAAGDEGGPMSFSVRLSEPAAQEVTVDYATVERTGSGAAEEGVDYQPASGTLTFLVGDDEEFIGVTVEADGTDEPDETFLVELSNQTSGVSLADASALGTINGNVACVDRTDTNQSMPTATLSGTSAREDAGQMTMTITLTQPFCQPYDFAFQARSNSATLNVDFAEPSSVRLPALVTEADFHAVLFDDDLVEGDETFLLRVRTGRSPGVRNLPEINSLSTIIDDDVATLQVPAVGETSTAEGGFLSFVMRLDQPTEETVTFAYETADGSVPAATTGADYAPVRGTATIPPRELSVTLAVGTIEDALFEHDENVELRLSNLTGAEPDPDGDVAVGRILDDDDPPAVSVSNPYGDEGAALVFAVTLDAPSGRAGSVTYSTRDGPTIGGATAGADYGSESGPLAFVAFAAGETAKTVTVQSLTDDEVEGSERFFLDLSSSDFGFDKDIGTGTIRDVTQRRVSVSDASVLEGGVLNFVADFNGPPASRDITVEYSTVADTAGAGIDYSDAVESSPRVLRILAGRTSAVVRVQTVHDTLDEDHEQLRLVLSDPVGAVLADSEAVGAIIDDDPEPLLSVDDPEAAENGDGTPVTFTLRLSEVSGRAVKVRYSTVDGTAKKGEDYVEAADGEVTIAADYQTALVEVALVDDDVEEGVERFLLELSGPSNARFGDSAGAATILDDDAPPQILIDDAAATYEAAGASVSFPVRLSRADPDAAVTVDYATEDATATAGNDYTAPTDTLTTNTLTFTAGQTATMVMVDLVDDDVDEDTETFRLRLSNPSANATLGNDSAVATILDDDGLAKLSVSDAPEATEGATATFSVELNRSSARAVTVAYAAVVDPLGGDAAAIPGQDFEAVTGTLTIAARSTSATVGVPLADDALDEHTETFWLRLSNPTGADVEDGTGIGTIADDDPLPQLSVGDSGATEGDPIRFTVTLDSASGRTVTVPWTTAAGSTGNPASPTGDYVAASGTLTFASGTTTAHIDITTVHDEVSEPDETFQIRLGQPTNATVDDGVAVGAIVDDDSLPRLSIAGTELLETDSPATFVVTLSHTSSQSVTVDYATTAVTATAGDDYGTPGGEATGTLVIPAGLDTGEISVYVADDDLSEGTETFTITLTDPVNAVIADGAGTATGTIRDADGPPRASIAAATATEGDATIEFPVTLSHAAASDVTVRYSTFDGTATQPGDYTATTATLTIPASSTTATIAVALTDDGFVEDPESFLLRLHDPTGLEIAAADAVGVIIDDDNLPLLSIQQAVRVNEDVGSVTLRVMLSRPSDVEVTVEYYVTALSPRTCPAAVAVVPGALVFAPGAVVRTFEVQIVNDTSLCSNRGIRGARVYLRNPRNAEIDYRGTNAGIRVFDLQVQPCVVLGGVTVVGEDGGVAVLSVGLQRSHTENVTITLDTIAATPQSWTVFTGSATAGDDYVALSSHTVDVPAGTLLVPVEVTIVDDTDPEEAEGFGVRVSSAAGADAACGGFNLWRAIAILDDDSTREVSVADVSVQESGTAIFVVSLDVAATSDITVDYTTVDGTAAQPGDYTETAGTVRIPAGAPSALVEVPLVDDTDTEPDETFTLRLTGAVGAGIADDEATATINDNDGSLPVVRLAHDETIYQGLNTSALIVRTVLNDGDVARVLESGHGDFFAFLDDPATTPVTFSINLLEVPSLGELAASRSEFAIGGGITNLSIMDGDTEAWVSVGITQDNIPELDERFLMVLNDAVDARLEIGHVWVEIIDDDVPIVTVADVVADESAGNVVFNVQLHAAAVHPASLRYTTRAIRTAGDGAASPGEDYSTASGTLNIPAGATSATISVPIIGDSVDEPAETFLLVLSDPELLAMGDSVAVGTITDDDPGFWIDDRRVWENVGTMTFTVVRDHTSTGAVAVGYRFAAGGSAVGGTACTGGVDFVWPSGSASGTVTMPAAGTEAAISVEVCNDDDPEGREILLVELTGVTGRRTTAVGTIVDDDRTDLPRINIYNSDVRTEGLHVARGGASFQIYADGPLTGTVTVAWRTENCLATDTNCPHPAAAGDDYIANSGTVTLTPTDISATVTVTVRDDTTGEDSEEFFVRVTGVTGPAAVGSGVTHTDPVGIGFIVDDD